MRRAISIGIFLLRPQKPVSEPSVARQPVSRVTSSPVAPWGTVTALWPRQKVRFPEK